MAGLLLILAVLIALRAAERRPDLARVAAAPALLACAWAGLTLPDIDQPLPLDHRSLLTHSVAPALAGLVRRWAWPVAAGLAFGLGLHLAADVFPNAMLGFATVKLPFAGSIGSDLSYVWLAANGIAAFALGAWLVHARLPAGPPRLAALAGTALIGLWYLVQVDGGWPALALFAMIGWFALRRRAVPVFGPSA